MRPGGRFLHGADCRSFRVSCPVTLRRYCNLPTAVRGGGEIFMTSAERREGRYQRRVALRAEKKARNCAQYDDYDAVFSFAHLYQAYRKCRQNVAWKASVQKYIATAPLNVYQTYRRLMAGTYKSPGFFEFDLVERGKSATSAAPSSASASCSAAYATTRSCRCFTAPSSTTTEPA